MNYFGSTLLLLLAFRVMLWSEALSTSSVRQGHHKSVLSLPLDEYLKDVGHLGRRFSLKRLLKGRKISEVEITFKLKLEREGEELTSTENIASTTTPSSHTSVVERMTERTLEARTDRARLPIPEPCTSPLTINLTEGWRRDIGSDLRPLNGEYACDEDLQIGTSWFRFRGAAGSRLSSECRPKYSCGGHGGFWSDGRLPTTVGVEVKLPLYGSWADQCRWYQWRQTDLPLTVIRCSDGADDFVYRVQGGTGSCNWTFCSE